MKKIFLFSILISLFLVSCSNLHFTNTTSVSMYLPELGGNAGGSVGARVISFPQSYDDSIYYYDVQLKQNDRIKYSKVSAGGTTITFTGINAGDYEIECNACVKKNFDFTVFARKTKNITALSGQTSTVDLELTQTPFITKQLQPIVFYDTDYDNAPRNSFSILNSSYDSNVEKINWYIDDVLCDEDEQSLRDKYGLNKDSGIIGDTDTTYSIYCYTNGAGFSASGFHKLYAEIKNNETGDFFRTNTVDVYFAKIEPLQSVKPIKLTAKFKGDSLDYTKNISSSDFYGTITYALFDFDGEKIEDLVTINYDSLPESVTCSILGDDYPGIITCEFSMSYLDEIVEVQIKRTFKFPDLKNIDPDIQPTASITNKLSYTLPTEYAQVYIADGMDPIAPNATVWYLCDEEGNIIQRIEQDPSYTNLVNYEVPESDTTVNYYFIVELTYKFDGTYCSNYPSGEYKMWTEVLPLQYTPH